MATLYMINIYIPHTYTSHEPRPSAAAGLGLPGTPHMSPGLLQGAKPRLAVPDWGAQQTEWILMDFHAF